MNIFATSPNPVASALILDDRRVNKMATETAQMLSTAIRNAYKYDGRLDDKLYKVTHQHHPCTRWAGQSAKNFEWLLEHGRALATSWYMRFGKVHGSTKVYHVIYQGRDYVFPLFNEEDTLSFINVTTHYGHIDDVHEAYQLQLSRKWYETWDIPKKRPKWTPPKGMTQPVMPSFLKSAWPEQCQ